MPNNFLSIGTIFIAFSQSSMHFFRAFINFPSFFIFTEKKISCSSYTIFPFRSYSLLDIEMIKNNSKMELNCVMKIPFEYIFSCFLSSRKNVRRDFFFNNYNFSNPVRLLFCFFAEFFLYLKSLYLISFTSITFITLIEILFTLSSFLLKRQKTWNIFIFLLFFSLKKKILWIKMIKSHDWKHTYESFRKNCSVYCRKRKNSDFAWNWRNFAYILHSVRDTRMKVVWSGSYKLIYWTCASVFHVLFMV